MKKQYVIVLIVLLGLITLFFYFEDDRVYIFNEYSSTGKLIGTNEYVIRNGNPVQHGKFINYNEKGIKIAEGYFVNNEPNGKCIYYYDNGKIESVFFRKNSKVTLESFYYLPNGKIKKYFMCDDLGEPMFFIEFDKNTVLRYKGNATYPINLYKSDNKKQIEIKFGDTLKVGDVIEYNYLLANIPYTERTFKIETEGVDNLKIKRSITKKAPTRIIVEEVLTKKGLNRIKAITQYRFNDNVTSVKNDTVSFNVYVK